MQETTFLSGKVVRKTLPVIERSAGTDAAAIKRLLLPQGELAQFYDADEPIHYMAFIELRDGGARGNHYHKLKEEIIYLICGELRLLVEDLESRARDTVPLAAGDLAVIRPGVAHTLRTVKAGQVIEFSKTRFNPGDTFPHPLS